MLSQTELILVIVTMTLVFKVYDAYRLSRIERKLSAVSKMIVTLHRNLLRVEVKIVAPPPWQGSPTTSEIAKDARSCCFEGDTIPCECACHSGGPQHG